MKGFLLDENLPRRTTFLSSFPCVHATELGTSVADGELWTYAREHALVVVSKDADFAHRAMVSKPPPWIVHLRFGNQRREDFHATLARLWPRIESLLPEHKLINVYANRIEAVRD